MSGYVSLRGIFGLCYDWHIDTLLRLHFIRLILYKRFLVYRAVHFLNVLEISANDHTHSLGMPATQKMWQKVLLRRPSS